MIEAHEAEPSEIIRGLIILLGAVYLMSRNKAVYGAHMPQVVDFMYQMMTLLLSRVSLLLKEQTAENLAAPSGIEESSLEYAEGFLKSITVILYAMQSDMMRDLYLVTSCRKIAECVGATCTLIIEFRKCLYYHPTHLSKPIIESKLPWLEFSPTLSLQKSNSTSTAPGRNVTIQLDSIKEIAIKICKIKVYMTYPASHSI